MAEVAGDRERQPINLFPVEASFVSTAFSKLNPRHSTLNAAQVEADEERQIVDRSNPNVAHYFVKMLGKYSKEDQRDRISLGILILHRALREKTQDLVLPKLTLNFVDGYEIEREQRIAEIAKDMNISQTATEDEEDIKAQAEGRLDREEILKFEKDEEEFSRIVRDNFGIEPEWDRKDDLKYRGIIYAYFIFKKGFSDPRNYQKTPQ